MKIKITDKPYDEVISMPLKKHKRPKRPNVFFRTLLKLVSMPDLFATHFKCEKIGMEKLGKKEPCLFLMNHSSFVDLEIVSSLLFPRSFNIVATTDSFIGKNWLMHQIGCIPTKKFTTDTTLVRDIVYAVKQLKSSIVLFPEASYSFDGTATPLPDTVGRFVKQLGIPVVMISTQGAFARDPLYNNLQRRKVHVSAKMEYIYSKDELKNTSADDIQLRINELYSFDNFRWQQDSGVRIDEPFRADYLNRVLYKCPACKSEGVTVGKGEHLRCNCCNKEYLLSETGFMEATSGETELPHIPDWYNWERESVREEIEAGEYNVSLPVDIMMSVDTRRLYRIGEGELTHSKEGFTLKGCEGKLDYCQSALASYSLYSDFNWYEVGDMVCIGNQNALFYCFPKIKGDIVAKLRLASEELYKLVKEEKERLKEKHSALIGDGALKNDKNA